MASYNKVILMGNLTRKPELRYAGENPVSDIGIAVNESYKSKSGEIVESTVFVDVTVWGKSAENVVKFLDKGSPVLVDGKLKLDQWETDQREKRSKLLVTAERVQFLGGKKDSDKAPAGPEDFDEDEPF